MKDQLATRFVLQAPGRQNSKLRMQVSRTHSFHHTQPVPCIPMHTVSPRTQWCSWHMALGSTRADCSASRTQDSVLIRTCPEGKWFDTRDHRIQSRHVQSLVDTGIRTLVESNEERSELASSGDHCHWYTGDDNCRLLLLLAAPEEQALWGSTTVSHSRVQSENINFFACLSGSQIYSTCLR